MSEAELLPPTESSTKRLNPGFMKNFQDWKGKKVEKSTEILEEHDDVQDSKIIKFPVQQLPESVVHSPLAEKEVDDVKKQADSIQNEIAELQAEYEELIIPGTSVSLQADIFEDTLQEDQLNFAWTKYERVLTNPMSNVGSILQGLASCGNGLMCLMHPEHLAHAGSNMSSLTGGMHIRGTSAHHHDHSHLDSRIESLSKTTGFSKKDLLTENFSAQDIFTVLSSAFGEGMHCIFCFSIIDCILDGILPGNRLKAA